LGAFEVGLVLPTGQTGPERTTQRWVDIRAAAVAAEAMGFDTVWSPDELLWRVPEKPQQGFWDGVSMAGAIAAVTSRVKVGTWVLSALHRLPGINAKVAETLDEISGGRFVLGLGAGHAWPGQATAFGLPEDQIFRRFEEALEIIVPLLRRGHADFEGSFYAARVLDQVPQGPRPGAIPLMIGGLGPKGQRLAARYAEIWSAYAEERSDLVEFGPRIASFEAACADVGRDPATIGRSAGIQVRPLQVEPDETGATLTGTAEQLADQILGFGDAGYSQVELWPVPFSMATVDALGPILELVRARKEA
jgi:alkanesulfonate monooxygenase SsuD/methylene tetrahydromethanopterin reductase-like flavin-dependent oxidoreductase (luciferase family)